MCITYSLLVWCDALSPKFTLKTSAIIFWYLTLMHNAQNPLNDNYSPQNFENPNWQHKKHSTLPNELPFCSYK